jgi:hypothetical protein
VDERILAQRAEASPLDQEHKGREERDCFYCLSGWVFLGSIGREGEEIVEAIRCRKCGGTGRIQEQLTLLLGRGVAAPVLSYVGVPTHSL